MRISGHSTLTAFAIYARADLDTAFRAASALDAFNAETTTRAAASRFESNMPVETSEAVN
jgi:hypothetical protein